MLPLPDSPGGATENKTMSKGMRKFSVALVFTADCCAQAHLSIGTVLARGPADALRKHMKSLRYINPEFGESYVTCEDGRTSYFNHRCDLRESELT